MPSSEPTDNRKRKLGLNLLLLALMFALGLGVALFNRSPRIQGVELPTLAGEKVALPSGRLAWVNFWSVTCPPCMEEMPYLDKLHHEFKGKADIVAISAAYDPPNVIVEVRDKLKLTMPLALDMGSVAANQFPENNVVPSHYLLDGKGNVLLTLYGTLSEETIRDTLNHYL